MCGVCTKYHALLMQGVEAGVTCGVWVHAASGRTSLSYVTVDHHIVVYICPCKPTTQITLDQALALHHTSLPVLCTASVLKLRC